MPPPASVFSDPLLDVEEVLLLNPADAAVSKVLYLVHAYDEHFLVWCPSDAEPSAVADVVIQFLDDRQPGNLLTREEVVDDEPGLVMGTPSREERDEGIESVDTYYLFQGDGPEAPGIPREEYSERRILAHGLDMKGRASLDVRGHAWSTERYTRLYDLAKAESAQHVDAYKRGSPIEDESLLLPILLPAPYDRY